MEDERVQFVHVARHLYRKDERWEQVIPGLGDARERACVAGCTPAAIAARRPDCDRASDDCRAHVVRDHDEVLAPAYLRELESADATRRFGRLLDGPRGWAFVGDGGVFVVVREIGSARRPEVKTAYRVTPPRSALGRPEDFFKAAVRKLRDKSSWQGGDP